MKRLPLAAAAAAVMALTATPAYAAVVFSGTNGSNLSASATFDIVSGHLMVTLTNTSNEDVNDPAQVLHALFWDMTGNPSLTYTSANICGSCTFTSAGPTGTDVGGMWGYITSPSGVSQDYGLSSAGYGAGTYTFAPGAADQPHQGTPPAGGDYGIVSAGYTTAGDNGGITNNQPYIKNSVIFDLGAFNGSLSSVDNIRFQYGTALTNTSLPGTPPAVPEPATWAMMLIGFAGVGISMRRRRRQPALMQIA
jgi:hypothetical protein